MTITTPPVIPLYLTSLLAPAGAIILNLTGYLPNRIVGLIVGLAAPVLVFSAFCFETGYLCWPHPWRHWLQKELHEDYHAIQQLGLYSILVKLVETVAVIGVFTRLAIHLFATLEARGKHGLENATVTFGLVTTPVACERTRTQDMAMRLYTALVGGSLLMIAPPSLQYPWYATTIYGLNLAVLLVDPLLGLAKHHTQGGAPA